MGVTGNTVTYTTTNVGANVITGTLGKLARVQVVDRVVETPGYVAVTTTQIDTAYASGNGEDTYNVPGGLNYNPDNNVDFIIKSNED